MEMNVRKVSTNWKEMPSGLTYMIIGQPKTGKTTAASSWSVKGQDGVLMIDTDLGSDFVDGANTVTCTSLNAPTRQQTLDGKVVKKGGDIVYEVVPPTERGHFVRSGIEKADWGKARKKHLDVVKRFQDLIKQKGGNLVLIVHSKTSTLTDGKVQLMPELPRGLAYGLIATADVVGYTTGSREDEKFHISFLSYDERAIGSRLQPLAQKTLPFNYESIVKQIIDFKQEKE